MTFLGIEIGGTKLQVVAGDGAGILDRRRFAVDQSAGGPGIRAQILSVLPKLISAHAPRAVGVGFGGPVDWRTGIIGCSHQVEGWADFPLAAWLTEKSGLPVRVDNDANVAAWAEARLGAGKNADPVFYVTLGSGVGGGLAVAGEIYHGAQGGEAEIGQMRLDRNGTTVESKCAGWAVDKRIRFACTQHPESALSKLIGTDESGEARHLAPALSQKDLLAQQILHEISFDLAFALSHVTHLLHPEMIVLGGGLSLIGEPLRKAVADVLPGFLMEAFRPGPQVVLSALREDAVPLGALLLAQSVATSAGSG